jgi:hypothetical protein
MELECNSQPANRLLKQTDPIRRTQSRRLGMPTNTDPQHDHIPVRGMDYLHASREFLSIGGKRRPVLRRAHEDCRTQSRRLGMPTNTDPQHLHRRSMGDIIKFHRDNRLSRWNLMISPIDRLWRC